MRNQILIDKIKVIVMSSLFVLIMSATGWAAEYYVDSNRGSDGNSGTLSSPWKSIGKANNTLRAGDTVYIRAGSYNETISPVNSGVATNRITYRAYNNERVVISRGGSGACFNLNNRSYITISGISGRNVATYGYLESAHHNQIEYCDFDDLNNNATGWPTGFYLENGSRYNIFYKVTAGNCGKSVSGQDAGQVMSIGNNTLRDNSNYNLIDSCTFYNGGHHVITVRSGWNVIRNCNFYNQKWMNNTYGNRCISSFGNPGYLDRNVWENNRIAYSSDPVDTNFSNDFKASPYRAIIRNNFIYDANGSGFHFTTQTTSQYIKLYNNTIFRNGYRTGQTGMQSGISFLRVTTADPLPRDNTIVNNIFEDNKAGDIYYALGTRAGDQDIRTNFWEASGDPMFINETLPDHPSDFTLPDLNLREGSPCIDAGEFLTNIVSESGSGSQITVADAGFFFDGHNITDGDTIQIEGQTMTAQITDINYNTNQITLNKTVSWNRGDGVSLPYNGSAPDFGAFEYGGPANDDKDGSSSDLSPPLNLRIVK